jgi:hypothetical protein
MSKFKLCMSIDVHFMFEQVIACQISKTCKIFIKNTHCSQVPWTNIVELLLSSI